MKTSPVSCENTARCILGLKINCSELEMEIFMTGFVSLSWAILFPCLVSAGGTCIAMYIPDALIIYQRPEWYPVIAVRRKERLQS